MNAIRELPLVLDPSLVEDAVFVAVETRPERNDFHRARDHLYSLPEGGERERAFRDLHEAWFDRLDLGRPLSIALDELPILAARCHRCIVGRAPARRDEGADLLVARRADGDDERSVLLRLRPGLFSAPEALLVLLRAELLHVADMLDPAFGYRPELPESGAGQSHMALLQSRYRVLWNASVAGRLARRGVFPDWAREIAYRDFAATFTMLGPSTGAVFARFFEGEAATHDELVALAVAPRANTDGLCAGGRCPLCRFPTHASEPHPERLPADVLGEIAHDFPSWSARQGLCRQCADLYRARRLSAAAADRLPGRLTAA